MDRKPSLAEEGLASVSPPSPPSVPPTSTFKAPLQDWQGETPRSKNQINEHSTPYPDSFHEAKTTLAQVWVCS